MTSISVEDTIYVMQISESLYAYKNAVDAASFSGYAARYKFDGLVKVTPAKVEEVGEKTSG